MSEIEHLDPEGEAERCPTCGQRVGTFTTPDGTSYYLAVAEQEASTADYLAGRYRDALLAAPMPERESIHKDEEWTERYGDWWHKHVRPLVVGS